MKDGTSSGIFLPDIMGWMMNGAQLRLPNSHQPSHGDIHLILIWASGMPRAAMLDENVHLSATLMCHP
ncbi:uncharacterized [Tachysurus ichikawai]